MMILYYYTIDDDYALYVCIILLFMSEKLNIVGTNSTLLISSLNISALPLYYVAITVWDLTHTDTFSHAYRLCLHVPLYSTTSSVYIHVYITSSTVYTSNVLAFSDTQPIFFSLCMRLSNIFSLVPPAARLSAASHVFFFNKQRCFGIDKGRQVKKPV